jgi:recombination protein RecA
LKNLNINTLYLNLLFSNLKKYDNLRYFCFYYQKSTIIVIILQNHKQRIYITMDANKRKALDMAMKQIDKNFGKGTIVRLGDKAIEPIEAISTGSLGLDMALGIGGVPVGRVVEIYGPESSGKTTLALQITASAQAKNKVCAFIDAEHALDVLYAKNLGVDVENLLVSQPDFGEQALDVLETLARSGAVDVVVVDSVAALTPKAEIEGEMGDQQVGLQARLMSKALRKLTAILHKTETTVIFINQLRMKIGMMGYGSPETTTGGNALKFYASVRIDVRRIATLKQGDSQIGNRVKAKVIKNKVAPPFRQAEFDIMFGEGISREGELVDYGVKLDIIDKSGAWFSYGEGKLGQGKENVKKRFREDTELRDEIEAKVKDALGITSMLTIDSKAIKDSE